VGALLAGGRQRLYALQDALFEALLHGAFLGPPLPLHEVAASTIAPDHLRARSDVFRRRRVRFNPPPLARLVAVALEAAFFGAALLWANFLPVVFARLTSFWPGFGTG